MLPKIQPAGRLYQLAVAKKSGGGGGGIEDGVEDGARQMRTERIMARLSFYSSVSSALS